jgi:hypothetical protein
MKRAKLILRNAIRAAEVVQLSAFGTDLGRAAIAKVSNDLVEFVLRKNPIGHLG